VLSVAVETRTADVAATSLSVLAKNPGPLRPRNFDVCAVLLRGGGSDGRTSLTFDRDLYTATVRRDAAVGDAVVKVRVLKLLLLLLFFIPQVVKIPGVKN